MEKIKLTLDDLEIDPLDVVNDKISVNYLNYLQIIERLIDAEKEITELRKTDVFGTSSKLRPKRMILEF